MPRPELRIQIARAANKANEYTVKFRRLRQRCVHYGPCPNWHQNDCLHKTRVTLTGTAGTCHSALCPLKEE